MKKLIAGLLMIMLVVSLAAPVAQAKPKPCFKDVDERFEWARFSIEKMYAKGIIKGFPGGWFKPQDKVTHLQAIIMALRIMGWEDEVKKIKVLPKDVKNIKISGKDGYYYVALAIEKGLVKPEELKNFRPNEPAKRYEVAKYIVRAIGKEEEAKQHMTEKLPFKDAKAIPKDAVGYVYVMTELGLMKGYPGNVFQPNKPVTRAEMAVIINKLNDLLDEDDDKKEIRSLVVSIDVEALTITVKEGDKTATYNVKEDVPVYINYKYGSLSSLEPGDEVKLIFNDKREVVFIQVVNKKVTATAKGILVDVDKSKNTVSLFTYSGEETGYVGILRESDIEGRHLELETIDDRFVLVGETDGLKDYIGKKIVVLGEINDGVSIYMRGQVLDVDEWFAVTEKNTITFDVTGGTLVEVEGKPASLSDLEEGVYAEVKAQGDTALSIKVIKE
ncbi:S-layer homology domain-containing protein [Thermosediminibacter oceani]|uniref:S-layer domain protein n=1 Tax=Thermosediminibacter oceani (strain ATCC BAA-1034 / DSM 16646 / JW/IW-1228P) TaxID=555079 RepID=D9S057_THEOJ|nr:S-layer homology domain-containing protein [Thermosediminibacter oceani]ADL06985.1 S-layer domain protein [Thermosediminibacter oceani DSM 16646]